MIFINGETFKIGNTLISGIKDYYKLNLNQSEYGTISGNPMSGKKGDVVNLSYTANSHYDLSSYSITGANLSGNTFAFNNTDVTAEGNYYDTYNPYNLPNNTIRLLYRDNVTPSFNKGTATQVSQYPNVWDLTYNNSKWDALLSSHYDLLRVEGMNSTNVTSMNHMFFWCSALSSVSLFDTSNVTDMGYTFAESLSLKNIPLFDTNKVTNADGMFAGCQSLTTIPKFNTSNVTSMRVFLSHCWSIQDIPSFDTRKVVNLEAAFANCYTLTSAPNIDTSNVKIFAWAFQNCSSLNSVPLYDTSNVTTVMSMYENCYNVTGGALAFYNQLNGHGSTVNHSATFRKCGIDSRTGSAELAQIPYGWK